MRNYILLLLMIGITFNGFSKNESLYYVDQKGIIRENNSDKEAAFFGVNYTLPFAHAYRAAKHFDVNPKKAIDEDVYHFSRLGFNAYRIHIWDVEISDQTGNLIENDHLDLLDYLIAELKKRDIKIVITAQTNFGNGYPELNQPTDGYTYLFEKCNMHNNPDAIAAQEKYIAALVKHVNPYTKNAYLNDPDIVGFEINNEPCHSGTVKETRDYINRMVAALKKAGNKKPVFYNVSHNQHVVDAYYSSNIQGTTYQWYPIGLVAGHTRKGNFLPYVDEYPIPFSDTKGFNNKAKLVYEFDPADILYSYMYPATVRSFRTAGFQWITQFAYDPMFMASVNTEYPTHFLNLACTPSKAISMRIAAEATYALPLNQSYGTYPADTIFGAFRVSSKEDLSEMNTAEKFMYSNTTSTLPVDPKKLETIAGVGNSPIVTYEGTGAYFLDKLENGVWRLEVMPDAVVVSDPFSKPSYNKEVVRIYHKQHTMEIRLPNLGSTFSATGINAENNLDLRAQNGTLFDLKPGVYLLKANDASSTKWNAISTWNQITLGEYVAPESCTQSATVFHEAPVLALSDQDLTISATIATVIDPDSVLIYPAHVSMYRKHNPSYKLEQVSAYTYSIKIPAEVLHGFSFSYTITVFSGDQKVTFPANTNKGPLDWDYTATEYYTTRLQSSEAPVILADEFNYASLETFMLPEWYQIHRNEIQETPADKKWMSVNFESDKADPEFFIRKYLGDELSQLGSKLETASTLCIQLTETPENVEVGFVSCNGFTYLASVPSGSNGVVRIPLNQLQQTKTALLPVSYPSFMHRYFTPDVQLPFFPEEIETFEIRIKGEKDIPAIINLGSVWIE